MRLTQFGTGAAERIPAIFCECRVCMNAKTKRGKEIRTQAQALVNDDLLLDFGGDSYHHYLEHGIPLTRLSDLLVTHWHSDHFYGEDLAYRMHAYGNDFEQLMTVHGTETVQEFYQRAFGLEQQRDASRLRFHTVHAGDRFQVVAGKYTVDVFDAQHGHNYGDCVFFGINDGQKAVLYAHDTGPFSADAWKQIENAGVIYDYVSLDCTLGFSNARTPVHMTLPENVAVRERLGDLGLVGDHTIFVSNHFSHNAGATHEELVEQASRVGFRVAYDGMTTDF